MLYVLARLFSISEGSLRRRRYRSRANLGRKATICGIPFITFFMWAKLLFPVAPPMVRNLLFSGAILLRTERMFLAKKASESTPFRCEGSCIGELSSHEAK